MRGHEFIGTVERSEGRAHCTLFKIPRREGQVWPGVTRSLNRIHNYVYDHDNLRPLIKGTKNIVSDA